MTVERTLPLRVPIAAGESLDSWLERLAYRSLVPVRQLMDAVGRVRPALRPVAGPLRRHVRRWASRDRTPHRPARRPARCGPFPGRASRRGRRLRGSRFCPPCLTEQWRLAAAVAAALDVRLPPASGLDAGSVPVVLRTAPAAPDRWRRARPADGLHHPTGRWLLPRRPDQHAMLACWIPTIPGYTPSSGSTGVSTGSPAPAALRRRSRTLPTWPSSPPRSAAGRSTTDFAGYGRPTMTAFTDYARARANSSRPARQAFTDPLLVAAVAVIAVELLAARSHADIDRRLRPWLGLRGDDRDRRGRPQPLPANPQLLERLSPRRQAQWLSAIGTSLAPMDRLRFRACNAGTPRIPTAGTPSRMAQLPQLLWPEWTVRFTAPGGRPSDTLREAIPCCLLMVGARDGVRHRVLAGLRRRWPNQAHLIIVGLPEPRPDCDARRDLPDRGLPRRVRQPDQLPAAPRHHRHRPDHRRAVAAAVLRRDGSSWYRPRPPRRPPLPLPAPDRRRPRRTPRRPDLPPPRRPQRLPDVHRPADHAATRCPAPARPRLTRSGRHRRTVDLGAAGQLRRRAPAARPRPRRH